MTESLTNLYSIINGYDDAKDRDRVLTFIEFIKEFGYDNSSDIILTLYRNYLIQWSNTKKRKDYLDDKEYVKDALMDTLKTITLSYSSYEEQDFLANIDWTNDMHKRAIIPYFARKIKDICDFYKKKRQEVSLIVDKNKFKGTRKAIEEVIYEKIIDFYFENRNQIPQLSELQKNLTISLEEYVDIYSEYFDVPRQRECTDASRKAMLEANMNDVNYSDYLEVNKVISEMIYSGEVYLEEIPLIAQVGLDLSAECAGDVENLRQELLNNATLNQISLSEQIAIRRKLYQKLLGCDLYYIYADENKNLQTNILVKADNPSGNLLNCGSADMALVESEQIKLISHIGLFFKPDKLGILKVHADDFVWEVNEDKIIPDTFYVFPEPGKYGDIGNNKDIYYPLVYEYKLDSVIKNLSSGFAKDEPLGFISCTTWNTYYTKQDNDFKLIDNKDYTYSFTKFSDKGLLHNYQVDLFNNEYGLFKGFTLDREKKIITVPKNLGTPFINYISNNDDEKYKSSQAVLINGGYFVDPRYPSNKNRLGRKFPHNERVRILENYIWTGITTQPQTFNTPDAIVKHLEFGNFEQDNIVYEDHYKTGFPLTNTEENTVDVTTNVFQSFISDIADDMTIIEKDYSISELDNMEGLLYFNDKSLSNIQLIGENVKDIFVVNDVLCIIKNNIVEIYRYIYDGESTKFILMSNSLTLNNDDIIKFLYNEKEDIIYILKLSPTEIANRRYFNMSVSQYIISLHKFNPNIINFSDHSENNFEYIITENNISKCAFSYNNSLDLYILCYIINEIDGTPVLYTHKFKLGNQDKFINSLISTCYRSDIDKSYIYNPAILTLGYTKNIDKNITFFVPYHG